MKLIIDIEDILYEHIKTNSFGIYNGGLYEAIRNGLPFADITDEQISDAFQIAIANYWAEKSKCLMPPPAPCDPECQTESLISRYQNDFLNKQLHIPNEEENECD